MKSPLLAFRLRRNKGKKFNFAPKIGWRALVEGEPATSFSNWWCVFEKIRTYFDQNPDADPEGK
ncbi:MAG: hypothetical protein ACP5T0_14060 [Verrucomicrobiia bacterium]